MLGIGMPGPLELLLLAGLFAGGLMIAGVVAGVVWLIARRNSKPGA